MMAKPPIYTNAPLQEAVFEIRFPGELSIDCHKDQYYERVRKSLPTILATVLSPGEAPALKPYKLVSEDQKHVVRFGINMWSFHQKAPYPGFKTFQKQCLEYLISFQKQFRLKTLKRVGLRYINHIPFVRENGFVPLQHYIKLQHQFPAPLTNKFKLVDFGSISPLKEGNVRILLQSVEVEAPPKAEMLVLDFDVYYEGELLAARAGTYLEKSHREINAIFEAMVTDEYRKIMEG